MATKKKVSLQQIADRAGCSKATVSLALNGHPRISAASRKRIQDLAREMGYRPNTQLSKLMSTMKQGPAKDQGTLGFIRSGPTRDWIPTEQSLFDSLCDSADMRGYRVEPFWLTDPASSPERVNRTMWNRGIEGLIIPMIHPQLYHLGERTLPVAWEKFSVVEISDCLLTPSLSGVRHNHFGGMLRALAELEAAGYRRIGLSIWQDVDLRTHHRWSAAYLLWKHIRGLTDELPLYLPEHYETKRFLKWVKDNRLDVVISPGLEVYQLLRMSGAAFPSEVGYATLDQWGEGSETVTGMNQDLPGQAKIAIDMLIGMIHRGDKGVPSNPIKALTPGVWCQGQTTRPPDPGQRVVYLDQEQLLQP